MMAALDLDSMRALAKEKREEILQLEKSLRLARETLDSTESRIKTLTVPSGQVVMKETAMRSLAKAVGWRLTAGSITFCTSFYFTKSLNSALAIVGSDFISKSGTMYIGERLFNKVQIGRTEGGKESPYRSLAKALIWRLFAFVNTMVVSLIVVKDAAAGAKIAGVDSIIKTALMVLYDQAWNRVDWGKELQNVGGDGI